MRKSRSILILVMCALLLFAGCSAQTGAPVQDLAAVEPTPEPVGMQKVFGREVTLAALGGFPEDMQEAMAAQARELGISLVFAETLEEAATADLAILYQPEENILTKFPQKVIVTDDAQKLASASGILLTEEGSMDLSFDALMNYSGHEAPVRVIGLFEAKNSTAFEAYNAMIGEGKLQSRGVFFAGESCGEELAARLSEIVPGLLDSIYAENQDLALLAFEVLKEAERGDAVEVICNGLDNAIIAAMQEDHFLMGEGVGVNSAAAGALSIRMAVAILAGEQPETVEFTPQALPSDTVYALVKEGMEGDALKSALSSEMDSLLWGEAALYLAEYANNQ